MEKFSAKIIMIIIRIMIDVLGSGWDIIVGEFCTGLTFLDQMFQSSSCDKQTRLGQDATKDVNELNFYCTIYCTFQLL